MARSDGVTLGWGVSMKPTRIHYDPELQPEVRDAINTALTPFLPHFPSWVYELSIGYDGRDDGDGWSRTDVEYRRHRINIGANFFTLSAERRADTMRHEVAHAFVAPLVTVARQHGELLAQHCQTEAVKAMVERAIEHAMESCVCDMAEEWRRSDAEREQAAPPAPRQPSRPTRSTRAS